MREREGKRGRDDEQEEIKRYEARACECVCVVCVCERENGRDMRAHNERDDAAKRVPET